MFQRKTIEKIKTYFVFNDFENHAVCEIMWKNTVQPDWPQMTVWRMRLGCWIPRLQITGRICNTYCSSTAAMVARTRLNITL